MHRMRSTPYLQSTFFHEALQVERLPVRLPLKLPLPAAQQPAVQNCDENSFECVSCGVWTKKRGVGRQIGGAKGNEQWGSAPRGTCTCRQRLRSPRG